VPALVGSVARPVTRPLKATRPLAEIGAGPMSVQAAVLRGMLADRRSRRSSDSRRGRKGIRGPFVPCRRAVPFASRLEKNRVSLLRDCRRRSRYCQKLITLPFRVDFVQKQIR
jgi:hypothetical protein